MSGNKKSGPVQYETSHGTTQLQSSLADKNQSGLRKYQEIFVGSFKTWDLIRYEFYTVLLAIIPGSLGFALRKIFAQLVFGSIGKGVVIGRSVTLRHPGKIHLDDGVVIDDYAVLDAKGSSNKGIFIGKEVLVGRNTVLSCKNGDIHIGDKTNIAMNCFIQSAKMVTIGERVLFAAYCYLIGGGTHNSERTEIPVMEQGQTIHGLAIEDNVWLGAGVKVMDGVTIGRDAIIGTGAVVTSNVPEFQIAVGIPARCIKDRRKP